MVSLATMWLTICIYLFSLIEQNVDVDLKIILYHQHLKGDMKAQVTLYFIS